MGRTYSASTLGGLNHSPHTASILCHSRKCDEKWLCRQVVPQRLDRKLQRNINAFRHTHASRNLFLLYCCIMQQ